MRVVVFVCGEGEFERFKGASKKLGGISYQEASLDETSGSNSVSHVLVLPCEFSVKSKIPESGLDKIETEKLLERYFLDVLTFFRMRFPETMSPIDVTIITHWNFSAVQSMEDYVTGVREKIAAKDGGIPEIGGWETFSYSSLRAGFFPSYCDIINKNNVDVGVPSPKDCEEIIQKLRNGYWRIEIKDNDSLKNMSDDKLKRTFYQIMAGLNH